MVGVVGVVFGGGGLWGGAGDWLVSGCGFSASLRVDLVSLHVHVIAYSWSRTLLRNQ